MGATRAAFAARCCLLFVIATAAPARAAECYQVEAGAKLYADVMGGTESARRRQP
jgi:hypothetical protein